MKIAAVLALVGAVVASANIQKRQETTTSSIDALSASLAVFNALPSSLQAEAITNPAAVASEISSEFLTGTPAWFSSLPADVQSYFISAGEAGNAVPTAAGNATASGFSNSTAKITSTKGASSTSGGSTSTESGSSASTASAKSSSSSGLAALPTQIIAGGLAGVVGLMGVLAL